MKVGLKKKTRRNAAVRRMPKEVFVKWRFCFKNFWIMCNGSAEIRGRPTVTAPQKYVIAKGPVPRRVPRKKGVSEESRLDPAARGRGGSYFFTSRRCGVGSPGGREKVAVHFGNFGSLTLGRFPVSVRRNAASAFFSSGMRCRRLMSVSRLGFEMPPLLK